MWTGGVRVLVLDDEQRLLLVRQRHDDKDIWMAPGGNIEEGENAADAAVREVKEETGLDIEIKGLLWHVEEVSERGQRFVNFFLAKPAGADASCSTAAEGSAGASEGPAGVSPAVKLGHDPELEADAQVLQEVRFMSREEMANLAATGTGGAELYPAFLRDEFWKLLDEGKLDYNAFKVRES